MVGIKLLGKKYNLPTQSSEVDTLTFLELQNAVNNKDDFDAFDLLSIITGIDRDKLVGLEDDRDIELMLETTSFIFDMLKELQEAKGNKFTRLTGEIYNLPKDFANMNLGQRIAINTLSQKYESDKDEVGFVISMIAVLVAPTVFKDEDWTKRTDELESEIKLMPVLDTIPIFNFF